MVKPEEKARYVIDGLLEASGWRVQNYHEFNLGEAVGVAIREFSLSNGIASWMVLQYFQRSMVPYKLAGADY